MLPNSFDININDPDVSPLALQGPKAPKVMEKVVGSWPRELKFFHFKEIEINIGGGTIQKYSGQYLYNMIERDFDEAKKKQYYEMTGNVNELNDPANANGNINTYPNVLFSTADLDIEPSIRGRQLYIPLDAFFCESSKTALPLVALQYQEINIEIRNKKGNFANKYLFEQKFSFK